GGKGESAATVATTKPAKRSNATTAAEKKAQAETPVIPDRPAIGEIQKAQFMVDSADLENGVLTLRQGKEPHATEVKIFLNTQPWHVPSERNFQINPTITGSDTPLVRIRWEEADQKAPRQRDFSDKYTLQLELGREQDRKIPGKILLTLPDE